MSRPALLRARRRARSIQSAQDVRAIVQRIGERFFHRIGRADETPGVPRGAVVDLAYSWHTFRLTFEESMMFGQPPGGWCDFGLGAGLRAAALARAAGRLARAEVRP